MAGSLESVPARYPGADCLRFGDGAARPDPGRRDIALDFDGMPALVSGTVGVVEDLPGDGGDG